MPLWSTTSPRVVLAGSADPVTADDAIAGDEGLNLTTAELAAHGIVRVFCLGGPAPVVDLPVDTVCVGRTSADAAADVCTADVYSHNTTQLDAKTLSQQLAEAAGLLEVALATASSSAVGTAEASPSAARDDLPEESSDEEGGSSDGTRLRVRVSRSDNEKWGITWHANIFKSSQRLVVKEIADDSVFARWNADRPERLQVSYGDRMMRINGVRADDYLPAQAAEKMRAELKKPKVRALFWRPGSAESIGEASEETGQTLPSAVLVCAGREAASAAGLGVTGAAMAAAVLVAHILLHGRSWADSQLRGDGAADLEVALRVLGEAATVLHHLGDAGAEIMAALQALATDATQIQSQSGGREERTQVEMAEVQDGMMPGADSNTIFVGSACNGSNEAITGDADPELVPQWTFSCRKCSTALFHDLSVLPHYTDGAKKASRKWATEQADDHVPGGGPGMPGSSGCTSVFVEPMRWMGDLSEPTGRLKCGNPRCGQKLGGYSWHGLPCSCGQWQSPAFQIHNARIECMPAGRRARGPAPVPVFNI